MDDTEGQLEAAVHIDALDPTILNTLLENYQVVDPVWVEFPLSYLTLEGKELEDASKAVAELLIEPTKEDADQGNRIQRVSPIFSGRDFLVDPQLICVLMPFSQPYSGINSNLKTHSGERGLQV